MNAMSGCCSAKDCKHRPISTYDNTLLRVQLVTHLHGQVGVCAARECRIPSKIVLLQPEIVYVDCHAIPRPKDRHGLRVLPSILRLAQERQQLIYERPPRVVVQPQAAVDPLYSLVPSLKAREPRREHQKVDLGQAREQRGRRRVHVAYELRITVDELVLRLRRGRRREGRDDGVGLLNS